MIMLYKNMVQFHVLGLIFFCNHIHHGIQQGCSEVRISSWTGFNHGQTSIETAIHSLWLAIEEESFIAETLFPPGNKQPFLGFWGNCCSGNYAFLSAMKTFVTCYYTLFFIFEDVFLLEKSVCQWNWSYTPFWQCSWWKPAKNPI